MENKKFKYKFITNKGQILYADSKDALEEDLLDGIKIISQEELIYDISKEDLNMLVERKQKAIKLIKKGNLTLKGIGWLKHFFNITKKDLK